MAWFRCHAADFQRICNEVCPNNIDPCPSFVKRRHDLNAGPEKLEAVRLKSGTAHPSEMAFVPAAQMHGQCIGVMVAHFFVTKADV